VDVPWRVLELPPGLAVVEGGSVPVAVVSPLPLSKAAGDRAHEAVPSSLQLLTPSLLAPGVPFSVGPHHYPAEILVRFF